MEHDDTGVGRRTGHPRVTTLRGMLQHTRPVRRSLVLLTGLALAVTGCGGASDRDEAGGSASGGSSSASPSSSASTSASGATGEAGAAADGMCGDGTFGTKEVEAADGVRLTVPTSWRVKSQEGGARVALAPEDLDAGSGGVLVQKSSQSIDQAVDEVLEQTRKSAEQTSEQDLDLQGFDGARMVTFSYDAAGNPFLVEVVAVGDGLRVVALMTREGVPEEQPVAESCLSTLALTSG